MEHTPQKIENFWSCPRIWSDETKVFIIGGGSSLTGFDYCQVKKHRVIGCNDAYLLGDWVDICIFGDFRWFMNHRHSLAKFSGLKVTNNKEVLPYSGMDNIKVLQRIIRGLSNDPNFITWSKNTGASAVNLATLLGSKQIYLLGFDMKLGTSNQRNWHKDNVTPFSNKSYPFLYNKYIDYFSTIADNAKRLGVQIFNCVRSDERDTQLKCFPIIKIQEAL